MATSYTLTKLGINADFLNREFESLSMLDLAKKLGVSYQAIWLWCKKLGVDYRKTNGRKIGVARSQEAKNKWISVNGQPGKYRKNTNKGFAFIDGKKVKTIGRKYPTEFYSIRLEVYKRDKYSCQECGVHCNGSTNKDIRFQICCHHIDYDKKHNHLDNLITLCKSCHSKTNYSRNDWTKHYQERVSK